DKLCYVLSVEIGSTELDVGKIPSIHTLVGCYLGLVTVAQETPAVLLIHATLQQYL
ncbi:hypothetical protein L873DRAFT_1632311, partial [Choiromyces venosus 120613-1]